MIDNNEITWLHNLDIAKDDNDVGLVFYANIGFFIEIVQMLEFNFRKLLCYYLSVTEIEKTETSKENIDEIHKKYDDFYKETYENRFTFGKLIDEMKIKSNIFSQDEINLFKEINEFRINIVHYIFQNNIKLEVFKSAENVLDYNQKQIVPMINKTCDINKAIVNLIEIYKNKFHEYKNSKN